MRFSELRELLEKVPDKNAVLAYDDTTYATYELAEGIRGLATIAIFADETGTALDSGVWFLTIHGPGDVDITAGELIEIIDDHPECLEERVQAFDFWQREICNVGPSLAYGEHKDSWNGEVVPYALMCKFGYPHDGGRFDADMRIELD